MLDTAAGLFRTRLEADEALRKLEEAGFGRDQLSISTPRIGGRGHYGLKVLEAAPVEAPAEPIRPRAEGG